MPKSDGDLVLQQAIGDVEDYADVLLFGLSTTPEYRKGIDQYLELRQHGEIHEFVPDYHRLQIEQWIYQHVTALPHDSVVVDIGVVEPRSYIAQHVGKYLTVNSAPDADCDLTFDITTADLIPQYRHMADVVICTEVLEHCRNPFQAMYGLYSLLRNGGLLLMTSPFLWPDHSTDDYNDYWRFTAGGWRLLCEPWFPPENTIVQRINMTNEGKQLYDLMRKFECFGFAHETDITTGYVVEARKNEAYTKASNKWQP